MQKTQNNYDNLEGIFFLMEDFNSYFKSIVIKTVLMVYG